MVTLTACDKKDEDPPAMNVDLSGDYEGVDTYTYMQGSAIDEVSEKLRLSIAGSGISFTMKDENGWITQLTVSGNAFSATKSSNGIETVSGTLNGTINGTVLRYTYDFVGSNFTKTGSYNGSLSDPKTSIAGVYDQGTATAFANGTELSLGGVGGLILGENFTVTSDVGAGVDASMAYSVTGVTGVGTYDITNVNWNDKVGETTHSDEGKIDALVITMAANDTLKGNINYTSENANLDPVVMSISFT